MAHEQHDNAGVIAPPPLIFVGSLAVGLLLQRLYPVKILPRVPGLILGSICFSVAGVLLPGAFREMQRAKTNIDPYEPVTTIVTEGPFRYTRNPIYLALALLSAGIAFIANAFWVLLLLPFVLLLINFGVIEREERYLENKFGKQYLDYKARVRRWV